MKAGRIRDAALVRMFLHGKTYAEIGRELGMSTTNVAQRLKIFRSKGVKLPRRNPATAIDVDALNKIIRRSRLL